MEQLRDEFDLSSSRWRDKFGPFDECKRKQEEGASVAHLGRFFFCKIRLKILKVKKSAAKSPVRLKEPSSGASRTQSKEKMMKSHHLEQIVRFINHSLIICRYVFIREQI